MNGKKNLRAFRYATRSRRPLSSDIQSEPVIHAEVAYLKARRHVIRSFIQPLRSWLLLSMCLKAHIKTSVFMPTTISLPLSLTKEVFNINGLYKLLARMDVRQELHFVLHSVCADFASLSSVCTIFSNLRLKNRRSPFEVKDREGRELLADELANNA